MQSVCGIFLRSVYFVGTIIDLVKLYNGTVQDDLGLPLRKVPFVGTGGIEQHGFCKQTIPWNEVWQGYKKKRIQLELKLYFCAYYKW